MSIECAKRPYSSLKKRREFAKLPLADRIKSIEAMIHKRIAIVFPKDREDVYQDVVLELVKSDHKWNPSKGSYTTWATWRIRLVLSERLRVRTTKSRTGRVLSIDKRKAFSDGKSKDYGVEDKRQTQADAYADMDESMVRNEFLDDAIKRLGERERSIVQRRFGLAPEYGIESTLKDIGKDEGLCKERVRQIEHIAINRLKAMAASRGLMETV